jgi:hypothetical protein
MWLTVSDALPYDDASSARVPDAALGVWDPVYVEFPYASSVADDGCVA